MKKSNCELCGAKPEDIKTPLGVCSVQSLDALGVGHCNHCFTSTLDQFNFHSLICEPCLDKVHDLHMQECHKSIDLV